MIILCRYPKEFRFTACIKKIQKNLCLSTPQFEQNNNQRLCHSDFLIMQRDTLKFAQTNRNYILITLLRLLHSNIIQLSFAISNHHYSLPLSNGLQLNPMRFKKSRKIYANILLNWNRLTSRDCQDSLHIIQRCMRKRNAE